MSECPAFIISYSRWQLLCQAESKGKKNPGVHPGFSLQLQKLFISFFHVRLIAVHEFVNPTRCIHQFHLAGVKRMGSVRDLQFHQWILNTFNINAFPGLNS